VKFSGTGSNLVGSSESSGFAGNLVKPGGIHLTQVKVS